MTQFILLATVFLGVAGLLVGLYTLVNRRQLSMRSAARSRLEPEKEGPVATLIMREDEAVSAVPLLNRLLAGRGITGEVTRRIHRAGVALNPGTFLLIDALLAVLGTLLFVKLGIVGQLVGFMTGAMIPFAWLTRTTRKRQGAFEQQLPEAIDMLVSALKSGYSFHAATNFLGHELGDPLGPEFARLYDEQRLGIEARQALLNLQERVGSLDMRMFVTALLIQRETGGNLSEVLSNTGEVMRDRVAVRGTLDTLTAEAKLSARLLAFLPVGVFFALSVLSPEFIGAFTASRSGQLLLLGSTISVVVGYSIMMKIANIEL